MKFLIGCYNNFRITTQLWQPSEWKNYDLEFIFPCNFQNKNDFPALSDTIISQMKWKIISLVWIFPEHFITRTVLFLKIQSAKSKLPCLFASTIEMVATSSEHFSANCYELFHSGELVLKLVLKDDGQYWFGFQPSYQPRKTNFRHEKSYLQSDFNSSDSLINA